MSFAPIALFVYKRPEHTRKTLEALMRCSEFEQSELYVFCDGAKRLEDQELVDDTRAVVRTLVGYKAIVIEALENQGLADSIISGVTKLVNEFGTVIVLEDDLVVSSGFLNYVNQGLEKYRDEDQVMQISGYMFPGAEFIDRDEAMFLPFTVSWGWATWDRAWRYFDPDAKGWEVLKRNRQMRKRFNLDGAYDYFSILESQFLGKCDSWAVRWYWSVFQRKGLVLFPAATYIQNIGFDGSGTHGSLTRRYIPDSLQSGESFRFPKNITISEKDFEIICRNIQCNNLFKLFSFLKYLSFREVWRRLLEIT